MNPPKPSFFKLFLATAVAASLAGCAGTPPTNQMLEEARAAYRSAAADPEVAKLALVPLRQAEETLQKAEKLYEKGEKERDVTHYAYLAKQRSLTAQELARDAAAHRSIKSAQAQRDQILIESRTREADKARSQEEAARTKAQEAEQRAAELAAQLEELQAKQTDRGMVLTLGDVLFDTGKSALKPGAMRTMDKLSEFLAANPGRKILVEGHTDSVGTEANNQALSERRAQSVRNALGERGISLDRIQAVGRGEAYPVASNDDAGGRQRNRRVEIIFSDDAGRFATTPGN